MTAYRTLFVLGVLCGLAGCAQVVPTPAVSSLGLAEPAIAAVGGANRRPADAVRPAAYPDDTEKSPLPNKPVAVPRAGDKNALELVVTPALERAYDAYFSGDGDAALAALDEASDAGGWSPLGRFHLAAQRTQTLIMMGRAADAEAHTATVAEAERIAFGTDANALALRAEARLWLADYKGAETDAAKVARSFQDWVLPTNYGGPPTNMAQLVSYTTAQLRSYTVLAGLMVLDGRAAEALPWAEAAERGFNAVHFVGAHSLYGLFLRPYPDSFYGRAFNLLFLGAARAEVAKDAAAGRDAREAARAYFQAIGYRAGIVASEALEAWTLYRIADRRDDAIAQAQRAVNAATDAGFPDFIWRIETLRGEILLQDGRGDEAEAAYRRADAAVDLVSGALSSDRAKLRYGVGKETITRRLAEFNAANGDLDRLFRDLERGRARAFVDMLADQPVAPGRQADLVAAIEHLNMEIRRLRVRNLSPRGGSKEDRAREKSLTEERDAALAALRERDPELAAVYAVGTVGLEDVARTLVGGDTLVYVLPAIGDTPIRLLVADRNDSRILEPGPSASDLRRLVIGFRDAVDTGNAASQERLARRLERAIGFPDWVAVGTGTTYVVPAGDFFFLPWGALPTAAKVVVLPTGGWLMRQQTGGGDEGSVSVIGDPAYGGALPQLAGARAEAEVLGDMLGVEPLVGTAATRTAVRDRLGARGRLLHIASHGLFDARQPLKSAIVLTDGSSADPVTAAEIFADPFAADLVVLSACETGMGQALAGDDFLGLARSFYLGGARSIMNSLWPVADQGTLVFMKAFHEAAARDGDYASAWLSARRVTQAAGYPPSVYGAFVLGGAASD